jgi:hypothetical protein
LKNVFCLLLSLCLMFGLVACGGGEKKASKDSTDAKTTSHKEQAKPDEKAKDQQSQAKQNTEQKDPLASVLEYFQEKGFKIGEKSSKAFDMIGAVNGFGVEINGHEIELYQYDLDKASEETKKNLESVRENGMMSMDGFSFPAILNGDILLVKYDEHPDGDKIAAAFKAYKAP